MEKTVEIIDILIYNDSKKETILKKLSEIKAKPPVYLKNNERLLSVDDDYIWLSMVDLLIDFGYAFEIDWKEDYLEVKVATERLLKEKFNLLIELPIYEKEIEPEEFFPLLKKDLLARTELQLFSFDIDSDSYVTGVVQVQYFEKLKQIDDRIKTY